MRVEPDLATSLFRLASSAPVMGPSCMQLSTTAGCAPYPEPLCCCSRQTAAVHLQHDHEQRRPCNVSSGCR